MSTTDLRARVASFFEAREWVVEAAEDPSLMLLHTTDDEAQPWPVLVHVNDEPAGVRIFSVLPDDVPAEHRAAVVELLALINYGLLSGAVEIDLEDGEVRARTGIEIGEAELDDAAFDALLEAALITNLALMDTAWDALHDVAAGRSDAASAAAQIDF
ncbi:YbjN domain-containing protein [Cellulomonas cellasea]|uniref:YbjN domain-containing protein n=1 Tax=Cellulomonas cellasea TaxID=43670 RepID=UPI0025A4564E|nr:YbjN domain-containing protein [Cellulomonas cellasea]MDM8083993.1 YbjN domain-containing protein [Cellulomonas cellasea]